MYGFRSSVLMEDFKGTDTNFPLGFVRDGSICDHRGQGSETNFTFVIMRGSTITCQDKVEFYTLNCYIAYSEILLGTETSFALV